MRSLQNPAWTRRQRTFALPAALGVTVPAARSATLTSTRTEERGVTEAESFDDDHNDDDHDGEPCMSCMEQPAEFNGLCWFCSEAEE